MPSYIYKYIHKYVYIYHHYRSYSVHINTHILTYNSKFNCMDVYIYSHKYKHIPAPLGEEGVSNVLKLLNDEFIMAMKLSGCLTVAVYLLCTFYDDCIDLILITMMI